MSKTKEYTLQNSIDIVRRDTTMLLEISYTIMLL